MIVSSIPRWPFVAVRRSDLAQVDRTARRLRGKIERLSAANKGLRRDARHGAQQAARLSERIARLNRKIDLIEARKDAAEDRARQLANQLASCQDKARANRSAYVAFAGRFPELAAAARGPEPGAAPGPAFPIIEGEANGLKLALPDSGQVGSLERRLRRGRFSLEDVFLRRLFAGPGVLLDIGAHVGFACLPHAVLQDFSGIIAVEPAARNLACLRYNAARNGLADRIRCEALALGSAPGRVTLNTGGTSGAVHVDPAPRPGPRAPERETAEVKTVDGLLADLGCDPAAVALVKCDTQGSEAEILAGAAGLLGRGRAIWHLELWPAGLARRGSRVTDLCAAIEARFTGFIDSRRARIERRPIAELRDLAAGLDGESFTDVLLFP